MVLVKALPWDSPLYVELREAWEKAQQATPELIRDRQQEWEARNRAQREREAGNG